ncbi:MAG: endonuclease III [Planctomycetes bacterium]|nr:endonuclease III [Planctomycetota bacterium]
MKRHRAWENSPRPLSPRALCRRLRKCYGPVRARQRRPVLDQLIATILSQHTSDRNSHAAFERVRDGFRDWEAVRQASVNRIATAIRSAGLSNQKAPRIKAILEDIHQRHGSLSLEFLRDWPDEEAMEYLCRMPGVGPKTAACVLLFACGKPVLPVDTHVHRVSRRLGLIEARTSAEKAHTELARQVPRELVLEFHVQLIRHGRQVCRARNPICDACVLRDRCLDWLTRA